MGPGFRWAAQSYLVLYLTNFIASLEAEGSDLQMCVVFLLSLSYVN